MKNTPEYELVRDFLTDIISELEDLEADESLIQEYMRLRGMVARGASAQDMAAVAARARPKSEPYKTAFYESSENEGRYWLDMLDGLDTAIAACVGQ